MPQQDSQKPSKLDDFLAEERRLYGSKAGITFKLDHALSKVLAFYVRPFSPNYLRSVSTTHHPVTVFGESKRNDQESQLETEYHENVHKFDASRDSLFVLKYGWPQIATPIPLLCVVLFSGWQTWIAFGLFLVALHVGLLALHLSSRSRDWKAPHWAAHLAFWPLAVGGLGSTVAASIYWGGWFSLIWLGVVLLVSPWPLIAFWRRDFELRGYGATLYRAWLVSNGVRSSEIDWVVKKISGPVYFFADLRKQRLRKELEFIVSRFDDNGGMLGGWEWSNGRKDKATPYEMIWRSVRDR